jgi:predicted DNA-binding protein
MEAEEMNGTEEPVKLQLDPEQLKRLRKRAEETGRTVGELIHEMFEKYAAEDDGEKS